MGDRTWLSFKGQIWQLWQKTETFLNWSGLSGNWFPPFRSGSVSSQLLFPSFPRFMPSQLNACTVKMTQIQIQYLLRQLWGAIFFLHHPRDKGGKNSQPLHQLSQFKSSKVTGRKQTIPFAKRSRSYRLTMGNTRPTEWWKQTLT